MIDLTTIDDDTLMARGAYSTINARLKDENKALANLCGELHTAATKILTHMRPDGSDVPSGVGMHIRAARAVLDQIEASTQSIVSLSQQKRDLHTQAWGGK